MQIIETSLYSSQRTVRDLKELKDMNVTTVIEPVTYMGTPRRFAETYLDEFERLITVETERCAQLGIEHLTLIGIPAADAVNVEAAHKALDYFGHYLARPGVVGIGEVGFENMTSEEESVYRRQARMARATGLPLVIQAPANANPQATYLALQIAAEEGLERNRVMVKGVDEKTLPNVLEFGAWAGLTVHPAFLTVDRAIRIFGRYGTERLTLQSDAGRGYGDYLAVPRTAQALLSEGLPYNELEKLVYHNPKWFYSQGLGLSERRARELTAAH